MKYNKPLKTVGSQTARLLAALYDHSQSTFKIVDVEKITHLSPKLSSNLIRKAVKRGLISRIQRGLFTVIPPELGSTTEYQGNPYLTAQQLVGDSPCFISHGSAMEIHRMVTQPQLAIFTSSTKRITNRTIQGTDFRFVLIKPGYLFGTTKHWVTKQEAVNVSDLEHTIIDGLRQPEYCGGITEVAKGLWIKHQDIQIAKLVEYGLEIKVGAVVRRLGYLLELYGIASTNELAKLQKALTHTYIPLDPTLPREGPHLARWRLQLNIAASELQAVRES